MSMATTEFICYGAWKLHLWLVSFCDPEMNNSNWKCFFSSTEKKKSSFEALVGKKNTKKKNKEKEKWERDVFYQTQLFV